MVDVQGFLDELEKLSRKYGIYVVCDGLGRRLMHGGDVVARGFQFDDGHYEAEVGKTIITSESR